MNREKANQLKQYEKFDALKLAVMRDPPNEVAKLLEEFGELEFTALALGLACRYRGLEMVKTLVEGGAKFTYDLEVVRPLYKRANRRLMILYPDENYAAALLTCGGLVVEKVDISKSPDRPLLPINDRLRILNYLYKTADKTGFDGDELLFFAYLEGEEEIATFLKKHGAVIPQKWIDVITKGSGGDKWLNYCWLVRPITNKDFISGLTAIISEIGGQKLHITSLFWEHNQWRLNAPEYMKFLLKNFDLSKVNKTMLMKEIIMHDYTECLETVAEFGWLKQPKKRDEMIAFATENNKTECTAWLLDFKNRTADLAAERKRAEKTEQRELNAAPDSVAVLKQLWSYKKREDGSIVIMGYKGGKTEIVVPGKIGKSVVTEIGERAFSPNALRITEEQAIVRCRITKITVPPSVKVIGAEAFGGSGVCKGNFNAYSLLEEVVLPENLEFFTNKKAAENAPIIFVNCPRVTVKIPHLPYAEIFCKKNKVNYIFMEEDKQ